MATVVDPHTTAGVIFIVVTMGIAVMTTTATAQSQVLI